MHSGNLEEIDMAHTERTIPDILLEDGIPDTFDMMQLSVLLYPEVHGELIERVIEEIGKDTFEQRLEERLLSWTPYALEKLQNDWWSAIDTWTRVLLDAKERFPETVGALFDESTLAPIWRNANIRAGQRAVEYLESGETQMRQPNQMVLHSVLFSGVAPKHIGDPAREMRRGVLRRELPKYLRQDRDKLRYTEVLEFHLEHHRNLNRRLIPHLRQAA